MNTFWQDMRYGLRVLLRSPGLTISAVLSLALGIGANTAIFSIVDAVLLRPLPVERPRELYFVYTGSASSPFGTASHPDFVDYRAQNQVFSDLAAYGPITVSARGAERASELSGLIVSGNYFDLLGVRPALGRTFLAEENQTPGERPVAIISHGLWQREYGADPAIVGREIMLNSRSFTIVGVAPPRFNGVEIFESYDLFVPLMMQAVVRPPRAGFSGEMNADLLGRRSNRWLQMVGRLKAGVSEEQAQASLRRLAESLALSYPETDREVTATIYPVSKVDPRAYNQLLSIAALLGAVVGVVLLVACANVANLLLARATARRREVAIRLALGASRLRLVRQLLVESTLLALAGGALGALLAIWALDLLLTMTPASGMFSFTLDYRLDPRVLAFTGALSLLTGVIFGLAPALSAVRPDVVAALKDEARVGQGRERVALRDLLVVAQVAMSLLLLISAGLFLRSLWRAQAVAPGFDAERVLTTALNINLLRFNRAQGQEFYQRALERVAALPGVEAASLARTVPLAGSSRSTTLTIEGEGGRGDAGRSQSNDGGDSARAQVVRMNVVALGYFQTMGIGLLRGRDFAATDREGAPGVTVVNESFVRRYFPNEEAIGRRVRFGAASNPWREIVGVVRDSKYRTLSEAPTPFLYAPLLQNHETGMTLHVRLKSSGAAAAVAANVRREMGEIERDLPLGDLRLLGETLSDSLFPARMGALLLGAFGALALVLAAIGLYGVMSYAVSRRTRELGIRMALGARRSDVVLLVLKEAMKLAGIGMAIGLAASAGTAKLLASFLFGISVWDATTFVAVPLLLAGVALAASYLPARRAAWVDPMIALRYE